MENEKLFNGYDPRFLIDEAIIDEVALPILNDDQNDDAVKIGDTSVIKYVNYSLQLSIAHKFPYYTASNIDGILFKKVPRKDNWRKDRRIQEFQWGKELYSAANSDFDRGHMTKREDVQWGNTIGLALKAADSTFYYSNAVPQHKDLNRDIWKSLEDYILNTETKPKSLRISVFTGPVLASSNPFFVTPINGASVQIPIVFWKIVVFPKDDGQIYRVGFMMSQNRLLEEHGIIEEVEAATSDEDLFMKFDDAATYQVNISLIEELTGLTMPKAIDPYTDKRSKRLVLKEIDIDPELESDSIEQRLGFIIENLTL